MALCFILLASACSDGPITQPGTPIALRQSKTLASVTASACGQASVVRLLAGRTVEVGSVEVWNDAAELHVRYSTAGGWLISETHLAVATSLSGIPVNKSGNPLPGHFAYGETLDAPVTEYSVSIPLSDLGAETGTRVYVAAHAVVSNNGITESAWGEGTRFTERGNWATYQHFDVQECDTGGGGGGGGNGVLGPVATVSPASLPANNFFDIAVGNGAAYLAWCPSGSGAVAVSRTTDGGASWELRSTIAVPTCGNRPYLKTDAVGRLYLLVPEGLRRSSDGGATFGALESLPANFGQNDMDVSDAGDVYVVGREFPTFPNTILKLFKSTGGGAFSNVTIPTSGQAEFPAVAVGGTSTIHVTWRQGSCGGCVVNYLRSTDGGATFTNFATLSQTFAEAPQMDADAANNVIVGWRQLIGVFPTWTSELYVATSQNGGTSFSTSMQVPGSGVPTFFGGIASEGNGFAYAVTRISNDLWLSPSTDGGLTWGSHVNVTETPDEEENFFWDVAARGGMQCVGWIVSGNLRARCRS